MNRPFKFLLFIFAIQRYPSVDCYAPGSLIWSRNLQKLIPIANVSTFGDYEREIVAKSRGKGEHNFQDDVSFEAKKQKIVAQSRNRENHNFRGMALTLGYVEDYNMVHFIANNTKVTGVFGEIWNTLAEYSNFTLVTLRIPEVTQNNQFGRLIIPYMIHQDTIQIVPRIEFTSIHSQIMEYTTPIWETRCRIYIKPEWKSDSNWIFNIFERKVWFAILFCFLLLSALGYLMQNVSIKVSGDKKRRHNLCDHLFYTFGTLCSRGSIPETLDRRSKILDVSKKIFAGSLLIVLSSHVMSRMTNVKVRPPFEDVESLFNKTKYAIVGHGNSLVLNEHWMLMTKLFKNGVYKLQDNGKDRKWIGPFQDLIYKTVCDQKKIALFELEDSKQAFGNRFCEMVAVGKSYFPTLVTFGVSKRVKYKRTFDIGILKMKEFGLIDRLKNRWMKPSAQTVRTENSGHAPFMPITLDQVLMLFIILGIGMVASAIIFVLEVIVSIYKSNQRRPVSEKMLVGKAALNAHRLPKDNYKKNRVRRGIELSEVSTRPIYVQNLFVVDTNCTHSRNNEYPHRIFYN